MTKYETCDIPKCNREAKHTIQVDEDRFENLCISCHIAWKRGRDDEKKDFEVSEV